MALRLLRRGLVRDDRLPVAVVLTSFDPGGTERQMTELIRRLDARRFAVHVVCFRREGLWLPLVERAAASISQFPLTSFKSPSALVQIARFARWCRARRIRVVHACDFYANIFALPGAALAGVPLRIGSRRDLRLPQRSDGQHRLQALAYRAAHRVVANSRAAGAQLAAEGVAAASVLVIPNGIDLSRYQAAALSSAPRVVTTVANLRGEKGHDVLLRAAAIVAAEEPQVRFQFVGDGPMRPALEAQARALGLGEVVQFLGHQEDVPGVLRDSHIFVLPSRTEAFPNGLLEAMAAALPSVASDVGGIPEVLEHERNGLLVPVGDHQAMAAAILRLLRDGAWAARLGADARRTIEARYSFERMVGAFEDLYAGAAAFRHRTDAAAYHLGVPVE